MKFLLISFNYFGYLLPPGSDPVGLGRGVGTGVAEKKAEGSKFTGRLVNLIQVYF